MSFEKLKNEIYSKKERITNTDVALYKKLYDRVLKYFDEAPNISKGLGIPTVDKFRTNMNGYTFGTVNTRYENYRIKRYYIIGGDDNEEYEIFSCEIRFNFHSSPQNTVGIQSLWIDKEDIEWVKLLPDLLTKALEQARERVDKNKALLDLLD
jgi:hypothetical protein